MPSMSPLPLDSIPAQTAALLAAHADEHGHFAALREAFEYFPAALRALDNQYDLIIGQGRLDRGLRELVFACAASARGDEYLARDGRTGRSARVRRHRRGACNGRVGRGEVGRRDIPLTWARKMATTPYKAVEQDMERLHSAGWRDQEIVEALTVVSLSAYMSIMSLTLKLA